MFGVPDDAGDVRGSIDAAAIHGACTSSTDICHSMCMTVTLAEVLRLETLRRADPEVVAGAEHLERGVRWVHVTELPDIASFLKGGELLLTTGVGLADDERERRRYVRELAHVGVAGLVVELGRAFRRIPADMAREAERCGIPLIALHRETRFVEVTEQVHAAIISRKLELLERAEQLGRRFTQLLLRGARLRQIVGHLASVVEGPVVLEDARRRVVEAVAAGPMGKDLLKDWDRHSSRGHGGGDAPAVRVVDGSPACAWISVYLREEAWGRLHVLKVDGLPTEIDLLGLDRAAAALALALLADRETAHFTNEAKALLLSDLGAGAIETPAEILSRARALGVDLAGRRLVAIAVEPLRAETRLPIGELSEHERVRARAALLSEVRAGVTEAGCTALSALDGDRVLAVLGVPRGGELREAVDMVGASVYRRVAERVPGLEVVVGASGGLRPEGLPRGIEEAGEAAIQARRAGAERTVVHFETVGLQRLLACLGSRPDFERIIRAELGPLIDHDSRSAVSLLPTLRAYLDLGGNKAETARQLHVDRRTLYHRLARIGALLACDVDDAEVRTRLMIAIRGRDLIQRRVTDSGDQVGRLRQAPAPRAPELRSI